MDTYELLKERKITTESIADHISKHQGIRELHDSYHEQKKLNQAEEENKNLQFFRHKKMIDVYGKDSKKARKNLILKNTDAINEYMDNNYKEHYVQADPTEHKEWTELHSKRSRTLFKDEKNEEIVEFQMGGSGFMSFRNKEHKGAHGKGFVDTIQNKTVEIKVGNKVKRFKPKDFGRWQRYKLSFLGFFSRNKRAELDAKETAYAMYLKELEYAYDDFHGERVMLNDKIYHHIRRRTVQDEKTGKTITKYNIAGAQVSGGAMNLGEHSIENNVKYIRELTTLKLIDWIDKYRYKQEDAKNIYFLMRGHSRGGVAAGKGALAIKALAMEMTKGNPKLQECLLSHLKIEMILHDPVAGMGSNSGANESINLNEQTEEQFREHMAPLEDNCVESTVFYSLHCDHKMGFTPQKIFGAKRLIISPYNHAVGLGDIEETTTVENGQQKKQKHSQSWTNAATGEKYRGQGISELPKGLYFQTKDGQLVQVHSKEDALGLIDKLLKANKTKMQGSRHKVIKQVVSKYFEDNK